MKPKIKNPPARCALKTILRFALFAFFAAKIFSGDSASAQAWSLPNPYTTNAITWLPQPTTNVILNLGQVIPQHAIKVQNFNINTATNNCTNYFYYSASGTNPIPYLIYSVNGVTGSYSNVYTPTGTNATDIIIFAATNAPFYGQSEVLFGTNATGVTNQGSQIITPVY